MTYNPNVPNASQDPGLFPPQNNANFTRLKSIIETEHVFNDTAPAPPPGNDGAHKQVTLINRANPSSVPTGTNSMVYGKTAIDSVNELWFYDQVTPRQLNWRELSGVVIGVSNTYTNITAIPTDCFGYIYLIKDLVVQGGNFVSNGSVVNGYSFVEKFQPSTSADYILRLGMGSEASALDLRVRTNISTVNGVSTDGDWTYKIFFRKI